MDLKRMAFCHHFAKYRWQFFLFFYGDFDFEQKKEKGKKLTY
jgi:hypothetical protein